MDRIMTVANTITFVGGFAGVGILIVGFGIN
jgi:hypothetical protein